MGAWRTGMSQLYRTVNVHGRSGTALGSCALFAGFPSVLAGKFAGRVFRYAVGDLKNCPESWYGRMASCSTVRLSPCCFAPCADGAPGLHPGGGASRLDAWNSGDHTRAIANHVFHELWKCWACQLFGGPRCLPGPYRARPLAFSTAHERKCIMTKRITTIEQPTHARLSCFKDAADLFGALVPLRSSTSSMSSILRQTRSQNSCETSLA